MMPRCRAVVCKFKITFVCLLPMMKVYIMQYKVARQMQTFEENKKISERLHQQQQQQQQTTVITIVFFLGTFLSIVCALL